MAGLIEDGHLARCLVRTPQKLAKTPWRDQVDVVQGSVSEPLGKALNGSKVTQRARFKPRGLWGRIYWYTVLPFHFLVFPGLLRGIVENS